MLSHKLLFCSFVTMALLPLPIYAADPAVRINELAWMGTTVSSNDEWIELYNSSSEAIDLAGWKLEAADGAPSIALEGTIQAGGYFLLERTDDESAPAVTADQIYSGALSNTSEWLKLLDAAGAVVDEINATDGWPGGDNTTKQTLERHDAGWHTSVNPGGTPKAQNSENQTPPADEENPDPGNDGEPIEPESTEDLTGTASETATKAVKGDVIITELFPDPAGADGANKVPEFIELQNVSRHPIDLTSWIIKTSAKQTFTFPSLTIQPQTIVVFYKTQTSLSLRNDKDTVTLYAANGRIIDQREYNKTVTDQSYQRGADTKWLWGTLSPGKENNATAMILPVGVIDGPDSIELGQIVSFDASDSFDPSDRPLTFAWDFGDGRTASGIFARQVYTTPGKYVVTLTIAADQVASSTETFKVTVAAPKKETLSQASTTTPTTTQAMLPTDTSADWSAIPFIFIAEFLPNPEGSDTENEFIELFNQEDVPVDLSGWQLDDAEGGSKPYTLPPGTIIKPGQYVAFSRAETKIALNNSNETVRLLTPNKTIADLAEYEESKEGVSYVLDEKFNWQQTSTPTPGEINMLDEAPAETTTETVENKKEPSVLGVGTEEITTNDETKTDTKRYVISGLSALAVLGAGLALKIKKH